MMGRAFVQWLAAALALAVAPAACAQDARSAGSGAITAREALRVGRYEDAIAQARRAQANDSSNAEAVRIEALALQATGKLTEAEAVLSRFVRAFPTRPDLWNLLGEVQRERGRVTEAMTSFQKAIAGHARDSLTAVFNLASARFDRGDVDVAMREFDRFIDIYNSRRGRLTARELAAVADACRYLGRDNPQLFKDALRAYDEAIAADSADLDVRVRLGELFLDKYQSGDAKETVEPVLRVNPHHARALLVMARLRAFDEEPDAAEYLKRSLETNPTSAEAHAFAAGRLVELERYDEAMAEARRGLAIDSAAPPAMIVLAAAQYLSGDSAGYRSSIARVHEREPKSANAEATMSEVAERTRLYAEAVAFAKAGTERDPKSAPAFLHLGINALRLGDIEGGRAALERAFALDPFNVWAKNTLDMLDTFKDYATVKTPHFELVIEKKDAPLVSLYAERLAEQAFDSLSSRYGYRPTAPVRVEFYRSHDDFSVRTVGLGGLVAILGVTFGPVVAMDSPAARKVGEFNWGSTLWHELAHVFTLGASNNRVPRWFSEGLSVLEEHHARPSWGEDVSPLFVAAYAGGLLPKVSRMNDGFMRPQFPQQVVLSYYMASLVCELIEREHGMGAIRAMLAAYRDGKGTDDVLRDVLKTDAAAFDAHFDVWIRQRFARELASVTPLQLPREDGHGGILQVRGEYTRTLEAARALLDSNRVDAAIPLLEKAKAMFPADADGDSPYALLARAHQKRGEARQAAAELTSLTSINEQAYGANLVLAGILDTLGDTRGAEAALERTLWISPFDPTVHDRLAGMAGTLGDRNLVVQERRALVALDPVDRVEALYRLALAYADAGDNASARREVLRALELAPNFEKAQQLLLRLRRPGPGGGRP